MLDCRMSASDYMAARAVIEDGPDQALFLGEDSGSAGNVEFIEHRGIPS